MAALERTLHDVAALSQAGRHGEAAAKLRSLLRTHPGAYEVHAWLACELAHLQQFEQAQFAAGRAMALRPDDPVPVLTLANIHFALQRFDHAAEVLAAFHDRRPDQLEVALQLLTALDRAGRHDELMRIARRSIEAGYDSPETSIFLAVAELETRSAELAGRTLDAAAARFPDYHRLLSLRAANALYRDDISPADVARAHFDYGDALARTIPMAASAWSSSWPPPSPHQDRKIRLGFISADFRRHACAYFYAALLPSLDRDRFSVHIYHHCAVEDDLTAWFRSRADSFTNTGALHDEALLQLLRDAQLDMLIEGSGHTHGHVLAVLHRRAAPIQATWMGYPGSTGVRAIDVRITDAIVDPADRDDELAERALRLDGCSFAFNPFEPWPDPIATQRDSAAGEALIFGSFNAAKKISPTTIRLWTSVLQAAPGSRLLIIGRGLELESARQTLLDRFLNAGVAPDRLQIQPPVKTAAEMRRRYREIDVTLDPFPYHGTTTTCESLMQGVPVLSLMGSTRPARVAGSLLRGVGLPEWACRDEAEYVRRAAALATPAGRAGLAKLRSELPAMFRSTLGDAAAFARRFQRGVFELLRFPQ